MALTRRLGRDAVTWIALGLVVASILIVTTRHASATKLVDRQQTRAQLPTRHMTASRPPRTPHRSTPKSPSRLIGLNSPTTSTSLPPTSTTTTEVTTTTLGPNSPSTFSTSATLSYPGDIATTYPLSIASGPLIAKLAWAKGNELTLALTCDRSVITRHTARGVIVVRLGQVSGSCDLQIARGSMSGGAVAYSLTLSYLTSNSASSK